MTRTPWVIGLAEVPARTALRVARGTCHSRNSCVYSRNSLVHSRSSLGRSVATGTRIGCTHSARFGLARGRSLTPQISPIFNPTQCPSSPSPRRPSSTMRILSSAEKCRRVARRIFFTTSVAGSFSGTDFCLIFAPCEGYDEPEILPSSTHPICLMSADGGHQAIKNHWRCADIPRDVTYEQMVRVVIRYIEARPNRMHEPFRSLALEAIVGAWPCRN